MPDFLPVNGVGAKVAARDKPALDDDADLTDRHPPSLFAQLGIEDAVLQKVVARPVHIRPYAEHADAGFGNNPHAHSRMCPQPAAGREVRGAHQTSLLVSTREAAGACEWIDMRPFQSVEIVATRPRSISSEDVQQLAGRKIEVRQNRPATIPPRDKGDKFPAQRLAFAIPTSTQPRR